MGAAVPDAFHARASATARRYAYVLLESPVRPSVEAGRVGWVFRPLDAQRCARPRRTWRRARLHLLPRLGLPGEEPGEDAAAGAITPARPYWRFEFEANAFLHHMIRNLMGCLLLVGQGLQPPAGCARCWRAQSRDAAAPTFSPDGLYFLGPVYETTGACRRRRLRMIGCHEGPDPARASRSAA
jgi:tRNA pseudouridine38-40 synthase